MQQFSTTKVEGGSILGLFFLSCHFKCPKLLQLDFNPFYVEDDHEGKKDQR